jgi:hypothetical protein
MNNGKTPEFYKKFHDEHRVSILQYHSLRGNFNKMVTDVLGDDYYNMAMDVYDADRICCEDITRKLTRKSMGFIARIKRLIK